MNRVAPVNVLLDGEPFEGVWQVRFYPAGISGGVALWGRPSAFTAPDGSRPHLIVNAHSD